MTWCNWVVLHLFYLYLHGHISSHTIQICCTYYIQAVSFSMLAWLPLDCLGSVCIWVLPILVPSLCLLYIYIYCLLLLNNSLAPSLFPRWAVRPLQETFLIAGVLYLICASDQNWLVSTIHVCLLSLLYIFSIVSMYSVCPLIKIMARNIACFWCKWCGASILWKIIYVCLFLAWSIASYPACLIIACLKACMSGGFMCG